MNAFDESLLSVLHLLKVQENAKRMNESGTSIFWTKSDEKVKTKRKTKSKADVSYGKRTALYDTNFLVQLGRRSLHAGSKEETSSSNTVQNTKHGNNDTPQKKGCAKRTRISGGRAD